VLLEIRCRSVTGQSDAFWRRFAETLESELSLVERTDFLGEFGFYTLRGRQGLGQQGERRSRTILGRSSGVLDEYAV